MFLSYSVCGTYLEKLMCHLAYRVSVFSLLRKNPVQKCRIRHFKDTVSSFLAFS